MRKKDKYFVTLFLLICAVFFYGFYTIKNQKQEIETLRQQNDSMGRLLLEQAMASFDAHAMDFTWSFYYYFNQKKINVQKTAAELTPEQRNLLQRYTDHFRFKKLVSMENFWYVDGGGGAKLEFDCPWGHIYTDPGRVFLKTPDGQEHYAHFEIDWEDYNALLHAFGIETSDDEF